MKYKIELLYIYGWDDAGWSDEAENASHSARFTTIAEAQMAIEQFLDAVHIAIAAGNLELGYSRGDFRIVLTGS